MNKMVVGTGSDGQKISRHIYGHFIEHLARCIYDGIWVGEDSRIPNTRGIRNDVVEALRKINVPNVRWPGGYFAELYHWMDGIGPRGDRDAVMSRGILESNDFGTHEFMDFCEQVGCEPYICGNVGTGTTREMREWVEYMTFPGDSPMANLRRKNGCQEPWRVKYWGVGNENWSYMGPEYYADVYRHFASYLEDYGDNVLYKIACGPGGHRYDWTEVLMRKAGPYMDGLSLHHYTVPGTWGNKGSATQFTEQEWFTTLKKTLFIEELVEKHSAIMDKYDPEKKVGLIVDEWGTWFDPEPGYERLSHYQQNTLRDAMVAGMMLNMFNNHCERVHVANIAQLVNVLQAMMHTDGEKMFVTPTYHLFEMYKVHQDATLLPVDLSCEQYECEGDAIPAISVSASRDQAGRVHVSICNFDPCRGMSISAELQGTAASAVTGRILTAEAMNAHNTFDEPDCVKPAPFDQAQLENGNLNVHLPPKSIVILELK